MSVAVTWKPKRGKKKLLEKGEIKEMLTWQVVVVLINDNHEEDLDQEEKYLILLIRHCQAIKHNRKNRKCLVIRLLYDPDLAVFLSKWWPPVMVALYLNDSPLAC